MSKFRAVIGDAVRAAVGVFRIFARPSCSSRQRAAVALCGGVPNYFEPMEERRLVADTVFSSIVALTLSHSGAAAASVGAAYHVAVTPDASVASAPAWADFGDGTGQYYSMMPSDLSHIYSTAGDHTIHLYAIPAITVDSGGTLSPTSSMSVLLTSALVLQNGSSFDLQNKDMIVFNGSASDAMNAMSDLWQEMYHGLGADQSDGEYLASGGSGLTSSTAINFYYDNGTETYSLTARLNIDPITGGALYNMFDGVAVDTNSILIKYTYMGDANVDGQVDSLDNPDYFGEPETGFVMWNGWENVGSPVIGNPDGAAYAAGVGSIDVRTLDPGTLSNLSASNIAPSERTAFAGSNLATFTDSDSSVTAADFQAYIDWGDGGVSQTGDAANAPVIVKSGSTYTVAAPHRYQEDGAYAPTITITRADGATRSVTLTSTVANVALAAPSSVTATPSSIVPHQVDLHWTNPTGTPPDGYNIYSIDASGNVSYIATVSADATSYSIGGVDDGTFNSYVVVPFDAGAETNPTSLTPATTISAVPTPTALSATAISETEINLAWNDNAIGETGYALQESADPTFATGVGTVALAANSQAWSVIGLAPATTYYFRVKAAGGNSDSAYSSSSSATTLGYDSFWKDTGFAAGVPSNSDPNDIQTAWFDSQGHDFPAAPYMIQYTGGGERMEGYDPISQTNGPPTDTWTLDDASVSGGENNDELLAGRAVYTNAGAAFDVSHSAFDSEAAVKAAVLADDGGQSYTPVGDPGPIGMYYNASGEFHSVAFAGTGGQYELYWDPRPSVSISETPASGSTPAYFTFTRQAWNGGDAPNLDQSLAVNFTLAGTAIPNSDYALSASADGSNPISITTGSGAPKATVTFAAGADTATLYAVEKTNPSQDENLQNPTVVADLTAQPTLLLDNASGATTLPTTTDARILWEGAEIHEGDGTIIHTGEDITKKSTDIYAGQKITLEVMVNGAHDLTNIGWLLAPAGTPADYVKDYTLTADTGVANGLDPTDLQAYIVSFYIGHESLHRDFKVSAQANYTGAPSKFFATKTTFNIKVPASSMAAAFRDTVKVDADWRAAPGETSLHFGGSVTTGSDGIEITGAVTEPGQPVPNIDFLQIGHVNWPAPGHEGVDNGISGGQPWSYSSKPTVDGSGHPLMSTRWMADSPGGTLQGQPTPLDVSETFDTYLMWLPPGDAIWVPLKWINWGWAAHTQFASGSWAPPTGIGPFKSPASQPQELPHWNRKL